MSATAQTPGVAGAAQPMATSETSFRFFRAGGVDQIVLREPADLLRIGELDLKLWVALAMPTRGVELDPRTADLIDTDRDGRIRPPELIAAVEWVRRAFKDLGPLVKGEESVALSNLADAELLAGAKRVLANLGKPDAQAVSLAEVTETDRLFAGGALNGDGIVTAETAADPVVRQALVEVMAAMGSVQDRGGQGGIDQARIDGFFEQARALLAWHGRLAAEPALKPAGEATAAADAAVEAVRAKVDDYFTRCRIAAFDPRAALLLNRDDKDLVALAEVPLSPASEELARFPLAQINPARPLPLSEKLNPAWSERIAHLADAAVTPLLGARTDLTEAEWSAVLQKLAPHRAWAAAKPEGKAGELSAARLRELVDGDFHGRLSRLVEDDKAVAGELAQLESVEKAVRFQRDLYGVLCNSVSFADFYRRRGAVFQAGTLFLDARGCELCIEVTDATKHAALAGLSGAFLAYCDITRPGEAKRAIVAVITNGDSDGLLVGRNGVFYDRKGRDWDATITKTVANPISIREAFFMPYKKLVRVIEEQISKRAAAAESDSMSAVTETGTALVHADKSAAKPPGSKLDLGTIALIGAAIGGVSALVGGFLSALFGMGFWMPFGVLGVVLLISGPSMLLAYLKLRQRNLGPLLDANGWAVNTRARMNVPFGAALTQLARLPAGSERRLDDPFAEKVRPWRLYITTLVVLLLTYLWFVGRLDLWLPQRIRHESVFPSKPPTLMVPVVPTVVAPGH